MCCPATLEVSLWANTGTRWTGASGLKTLHDGFPVKLKAQEGPGGHDDVLKVTIDGVWPARALAVEAVGTVQVAGSICREREREREREINLH